MPSSHSKFYCSNKNGSGEDCGDRDKPRRKKCTSDKRKEKKKQSPEEMKEMQASKRKMKDIRKNADHFGRRGKLKSESSQTSSFDAEANGTLPSGEGGTTSSDNISSHVTPTTLPMSTEEENCPDKNCSDERLDTIKVERNVGEDEANSADVNNQNGSRDDNVIGFMQERDINREPQTPPQLPNPSLGLKRSQSQHQETSEQGENTVCLYYLQTEDMNNNDETYKYTPKTPTTTPPVTPPPINIPQENIITLRNNEPAFFHEQVAPPPPFFQSNPPYCFDVPRVPIPMPCNVHVKQEIDSPLAPPTPDLFMNHQTAYCNPPRYQAFMPWLMAPTIRELSDKVVTGRDTQEATPLYPQQSQCVPPPFYSCVPGPAPMTSYDNHAQYCYPITQSANIPYSIPNPHDINNGHIPATSYTVSVEPERSPTPKNRGARSRGSRARRQPTTRRKSATATVTSESASIINGSDISDHQYGMIWVPPVGEDHVSHHDPSYGTIGTQRNHKRSKSHEMNENWQYDTMDGTSMTYSPTFRPVSPSEDLTYSGRRESDNLEMDENSNWHELKLSPFITPTEAERRCLAIGKLAAQKEIDCFSALIRARSLWLMDRNEVSNASIPSVHIPPAPTYYYNADPICQMSHMHPSPYNYFCVNYHHPQCHPYIQDPCNENYATVSNEDVIIKKRKRASAAKPAKPKRGRGKRRSTYN